MLNQIKKALNVTARIYDFIRETAVAGMTEQELFSLIEQELNKLGYQKEHYAFDFLSGFRTSDIDGGPTSKTIEKSDLLLVDFSLQHEGTWCDTCRTFFLGTPSKEQADAYNLLLTAMEAGFKMLSSHTSGECVYQAVIHPIEQRHMKKNMPHHAGHAIGAHPFQNPVLDRGSKDLLKAGDAVTLEPGIYIPDKWGIRMENDFLVTEEGAELLFHYPMDLEYFILR